MSEFRKGQRVERTDEARRLFPGEAAGGVVVGFGRRRGWLRVVLDGDTLPTACQAEHFRPAAPAWRGAPDAAGWWWLWEDAALPPQAVLVAAADAALDYVECGSGDWLRPCPGQKWLALTPPAPPSGG